MSETKKHTHVAVHAIQRRDEKGNTAEIAPGAEFTPASSAEREHLEGCGAAKRLKAAAVAEQVDPDKGGKK